MPGAYDHLGDLPVRIRQTLASLPRVVRLLDANFVPGLRASTAPLRPEFQPQQQQQQHQSVDRPLPGNAPVITC